MDATALPILSAGSMLLHAAGFAFSIQSPRSMQGVSELSINTAGEPGDLCSELSYRGHHVNGPVIAQGIAWQCIEHGFGGTLHERLSTSFLDRPQPLDAVLQQS